MSAIQNALNDLNAKLSKLESVVESHEQKASERALKEKQQDLFGGAAAKNGNGGSNVYTIDPALLASKLDMAIDKVEKILQEG